MKKRRNEAAAQIDFDTLAEALLIEIADGAGDGFDELVDWLSDAARDPTAIERLLKFKHEPVGPREFIEDPDFMNAAGSMWPAVMDEFCELNSGAYVESVLTGGIGTGKTHLALYTQAYQLYLLSCLRNPHKEFDLDPSSEIVVVFQSITKDLAKGVDYQRFRSMISKAPYFQNHFAFRADYESEMRFPNRIIVKPISGEDTGAIGQNVIGGIIDEINFMAVTENSKLSRDGGTHDQAIKNYNSIARRRESRFLQLGSLPGMLCLVSSRNYPGQFTDKKEAEAKTNPRIFVYDKRTWEVRPERFSGNMFGVFIGDATRKPFILQPDQKVAVKDEHLILQVPVEYREQFENDLLNALRDIGGVATLALHPFMLKTEAVAAAFGKVQSIASREDCDFVETRVSIYPKRVRNPRMPRLVHIDLAYAKDSAGVSIGYVESFMSVSRGDHVETLPVVEFDMILEVEVPRGGEIEFEHLRKLIYTLRDKVGLPIKWVSFDGFQSRDSMQIMAQRGFVVDYQSMDRDTVAYDYTKQAFYDGRVRAPMHAKALREMTTLEIDVKKGKIDHPPHGSKDVADSMAGVIVGLTLMRENWMLHGVPLQQVPKSVLNAQEPGSATKVRKNDMNTDDWVDD